MDAAPWCNTLHRVVICRDGDRAVLHLRGLARPLLCVASFGQRWQPGVLMLIQQFQDPESSTFTYLLADVDAGEAVLIDPVAERVDEDLATLSRLGLHLVHTVETHVHADHITGASRLRERTGCTTVTGRRAAVVCADHLLGQGQKVRFGRFSLEARETPGHTDGCTTWVAHEGRAVFTGDTLLIGGCGRTDFQHGDAATLYRSVHEQIFTLPDDFVVYPGHDYKGRTQSTVGAEKQGNARLGGGRDLQSFVALMAALDLPYPKKIDASLPANQQCGRPAPPIDFPESGLEVEPNFVLENRALLRLVDVREPHEFMGPLGHAAGAENVPLGALEGTVQAWDRERPVALICQSGRRSLDAAQRMVGMGFRRVGSVRGGTLRWADAALPRQGQAEGA